MINKLCKNKINKIIKKIPESKNDPMVNYQNTIKQPKKSYAVQRSRYQPNKKIISNMKYNSSAGNYNISGKMIKIITKILLPLIVELVNETIRTKSFPNITKNTQTITCLEEQ